jgi:hypothetical protein
MCIQPFKAVKTIISKEVRVAVPGLHSMSICGRLGRNTMMTPVLPSIRIAFIKYTGHIDHRPRAFRTSLVQRNES